jgi:hypothetical protein
MTLLNLNSPEGRSPRGKKSSRVWMGFGLIIAVLGLGSTFAANININGDRPSEFGQGLTQTVYCGENDEGESITVTPISAFVNSVDIVGDEVWREPVFTGKTFVPVGSFSVSALNVRSFTDVYVNDETGEEETQVGYWVKDRISDDYYSRNIFRGDPRPTPGVGIDEFDTFVPLEQENGIFGFYKYTSWIPGREVDTTVPTFELGGITITDIPTSCVGRDFIISAYGSTGSDPLELSSALEVTEIAVNWDPLDLEPDYSFNRRIPGIPTSNDGKVVIEQAGTENSLKIIFSSTAGRLLTDAFAKIVVETQENIVGDANIETLAD